MRGLELVMGDTAAYGATIPFKNRRNSHEKRDAVYDAGCVCLYRPFV